MAVIKLTNGAMFTGTPAECAAFMKVFGVDTPAKKAGKKVQAAPKELIDYTKANGEVVKCTEKQAAAWDAWKSNAKAPQYESKEQFTEAMQALKDAFKWTSEADEFIKAHPLCTQKEFSQAGFKGCTKAMLKEHKAEMRTAGLIK